MEGDEVWDLLSAAFGKQKPLWEASEKEEAPGVTEKLIHYAISYADRPAPARTAVRTFVGVGEASEMFSGWDEVRVASNRDIADVLTASGVSVNAWELAESIREFLNYSWKHLASLDLNEVVEQNKAKLIENYLAHVPLQPRAAVDYLKVLWNRTNQMPYEAHTDRVLSRLGVVNTEDFLGTKAAALQKLVGPKKPLVFHRKMLQLAKSVCLVKDPRCDVCPLSKGCSYARAHATV